VADVDAVKLASPASLNDCMMRNVYRYRYTVVIDFDEVIVPRFHDDYTQMVAHINRKNRPRQPPHAYVFHNTYFFLDQTPDVEQPAHIRSLSLRRHAPPFGINASVVRRPFLKTAHCTLFGNIIKMQMSSFVKAVTKVTFSDLGIFCPLLSRSVPSVL